MRKIELLSPAGGMEALHAAVCNGADAVYLGEKSFSARQSAENFDADSLKTAVKYAHERGTNVYLAMNTLINHKECEKFEKGVEMAAKSGIDALIIQDFGGAEIARRVCPSLPIHASTQMSAHNEKDALALLERGFSRIVLARELKMEEIAKIYRNTKASLEVFVHGALCVCVSGQCLMSSFIGGRSGNRGRCAQPCRQQYTAEGKRGYYLSPRDLCLLDEIESLDKIGVDSLKIEGRMKSPEYVATVTGIYRKYLDDVKRASREDIKELEKVFVRGDGFTKAYYAGINTPEIMNYDLSNDGISYRSDKDVLKKAALSYREGVENKKVSVTGFLTIKENEPSSLILTDGENTVTSYGAVPVTALNVPLGESVAKERIGKMGQTPFTLDYFEAYIDPCLTMSAKDINLLRRDATDKLLNERGKIKELETFCFEYEYKTPKKSGQRFSASVKNLEQLKGAEEADIIYMPLGLYEKSEKKDNYVVELPKVTYDIESYITRLKKADALRATASTVGIAKALIDAGIECIGDYGLNIFNPVTSNEYAKMGISHLTLSPELTVGEIRSITQKTDAVCEVLAYGRQLMMTTRACIIKGVRGKCNCDKPLKLIDKTGATFLVYADKYEHINQIYNTAVTFMADKKDVLNDTNADVLRLVFTDESEEEVRNTIKMYKGEIEAVLPKSFTRGYFANTKKK